MYQLVILILFLMSFYTYGQSINNHTAMDIRPKCLQAGSAVSSAKLDSYKEIFSGPDHFNYKDVSHEPISEYELYTTGPNPSVKKAYLDFLRSLVAIEESYLREGRKIIGEKIKSKADAINLISNARDFIMNSDKDLDYGHSYMLHDSDELLIPYKDMLSTGACLWIGGGIKCKNTLDYLDHSLNRSLTRLGDTIYPNYINWYLFTEKPRNYLNTVALKFLDLFDDYLIHDKLPKRDVFEIITHELEDKLNLSKKDSREIALQILVLYGTRGATWFNRIIEGMIGVGRSGTSLLVITSALQFFDKLTYMRFGKQFSIPKQIKGNCYYGKNYHFWTAAFMAFDSNYYGGYSIKNSIQAAHLFGVGYELGRASSLLSTYSSLPLEKKDFHSARANAVRLDLTYNTLGAWFGAFGSSPEGRFKEINGVTAYAKVLNASSKTKASILRGMDLLSDLVFIQYYAPNAHLSYVLKKTQ